MRQIGFDQDKFFFYQGDTSYGYPVWPTPTMLAVSIVDESTDEIAPTANSDAYHYPFIFLEDGYDPSSRVRKGRLYKKNGIGQPISWYLEPHPMEYPAPTARGQKITKPLFSFESFHLESTLKALGISRPLFLMGSNDQFTVWTIVASEWLASKELALFLRARESFGAIPRLDFSKIHTDFHAGIRTELDSVTKANFLAGPESLVDCVREAMTAILGAYFKQVGAIDGFKDLGDLATIARSNNLFVVANCASAIAKFHSRRKAVEKASKNMRRLTERDAQFAIEAIGVVVRDIGWES